MNRRNRYRRSSATRLITLCLLLGAVLVGCGGPEELTPADFELEESSDALRRGKGGPKLSYSCTNGVCTCDKSIENDCENMSAVCEDADIDPLINCINGWLTTHCTCDEAKTSPTTGSTYDIGPINEVYGGY